MLAPTDQDDSREVSVRIGDATFIWLRYLFIKPVFG